MTTAILVLLALAVLEIGALHYWGHQILKRLTPKNEQKAPLLDRAANVVFGGPVRERRKPIAHSDEELYLREQKERAKNSV